jgi:glucosamine--fructose-6-phosphate aminotransferase (isomerizing)
MHSETLPAQPRFREARARQATDLAVAAARAATALKGLDIERDYRGSLLFAGIGASHAALASPVHELRGKGRVAFRSSCSDIPSGSPVLADTYVLVSQSGRSRETVQLVQQSPAVHHLAVVNGDGPLGAQCEDRIAFGRFPDSFMSSIGFTGSLVALGMLVESITRDPRPVGEWASLGERADALTDAHEPLLADFAGAVASRGSVDIVGEAKHLSAVEQATLMFREGPWVQAAGTDTRQYLHGPMDVAHTGASAHIVIGAEREALLVEQLALKGVRILFLTPSSVEVAVPTVRLPPELTPTQTGVVATVLLQRLVELTGDALGVDVDEKVFVRLDTKVDAVGELGETGAS